MTFDFVFSLFNYRLVVKKKFSDIYINRADASNSLDGINGSDGSDARAVSLTDSIHNKLAQVISVKRYCIFF